MNFFKYSAMPAYQKMWNFMAGKENGDKVSSKAVHLPKIFGILTFAKVESTIILMVENFSKFIPTFDVLFLSKPQPKVPKLSTCVENVKNVPEFLKIPVHSSTFLIFLTYNSGTFFNWRHDFWPFDKCRKCTVIFDFQLWRKLVHFR